MGIRPECITLIASMSFARNTATPLSDTGGASSGDALRAQYERFPYPPIGRFALPLRAQGEPLRYEHGLKMAGLGQEASSTGIRILVAGAGTLEPLVVAQAHPRAREVVAVDISRASLDRLKSRERLARW